MMRPHILLFLCLILASPANAQQITDDYSPESGDSVIADKHTKHLPLNNFNAIGTTKPAKQFIVSSANPLASQTAYDVLNKGGNAIDAMVAIQTVLGLVEPQSSGLGGGAFLVYYDAKSKRISTYDGRETAPIKAPDNLFMTKDATPMQFFDAVVGGRSVGTPGTVKLLWEIHQTHGSKLWSELLSPAISLANKGFMVSPRLANAIKNDETRLTHDKASAEYFFPEGLALRSGETLRNPEYAETLSLLSQHGGDYFYRSEISHAIVSKVQSAKNQGYLSQADFDQYAIKERKPTCSSYRQFEVCGMGPPSSGAITVNQTLGILSNFNLATRSPDKAETWQLIAEASRLSFADRGLYIADPDFVQLPKGLLAPEYLKQRASLIKAGKASQKIQAGTPDHHLAKQFSLGRSPEQASTSHFVIVDKAGNIVSMTSTIENGFGSRLMVKGFLLNNELTDFSFKSEQNGKFIANRVTPGKRPRSSMAPTIVLKNNKPYLALGSPGGSSIITYVANALIAILDWKMPIQKAFNLPHIINRFGKMELEAHTPATKHAQAFSDMGYQVSKKGLNSGLHGVLFTPQGMLGAADKRREGLVLGL